MVYFWIEILVYFWGEINNYYDEFVRTAEENMTIGIVLCKQKNETLVQITLPKDNQLIFASKYQTVLPSKEELKQLIENKE
ncbi:MAG: DUF1016 domain-containing protein [Porphyromonadaceae bacterium]|nr:DUF1016 domain-containing protein [Porphyromonadaceae bacterium]